MNCRWRIEVKLVIFAVVKVSTGFELMTSTIPVQCSTNWAMEPCRKQVKSELNLYPLYEEGKMMCISYKSYVWTADASEKWSVNLARFCNESWDLWKPFRDQLSSTLVFLSYLWKNPSTWAVVRGERSSSGPSYKPETNNIAYGDLVLYWIFRKTLLPQLNSDNTIRNAWNTSQTSNQDHYLNLRLQLIRDTDQPRDIKFALIGYFRVAFRLCFKASPRVKPFI